MKREKLTYLIYLIVLHGVFMLLSVSRFTFPRWGEWLTQTRFLQSSVPLYMVLLIAIGPLLSALPYYFKYDFPHASAQKKWTLAGLLIGNLLLILTYTAMITKIMS